MGIVHEAADLKPYYLEATDCESLVQQYDDESQQRPSSK